MRYHAPDDRIVLTAPTPETLEELLRTSPHSYWQQGGNGEAILEDGPGKPTLCIKQPEPGRFFLTHLSKDANWLVPYDGGSCEELVWDERAGDPFLIPRACLIDTNQAVDVVKGFLVDGNPTSSVAWRYWHELPLPDEARRLSGEG